MKTISRCIFNGNDQIRKTKGSGVRDLQPKDQHRDSERFRLARRPVLQMPLRYERKLPKKRGCVKTEQLKWDGA